MAESKRDLHAEITDRIIEAIESGQANPEEWAPPWASMTAQGLPSNASTGKRYRGINVLNLWASAQLAGFESSKWGTFRQWKSLGASVRKGSKSARVVFYKALTVEDRETGEERQIPMLRYSSVFNASQVEGWEDPDAAGFEPPNAAELVAELEAWLLILGR